MSCPSGSNTLIFIAIYLFFELENCCLKGKTWKGIYCPWQGNSLTICDNAENLDAERPSTFDARSGSGYILVTL